MSKEARIKLKDIPAIAIDREAQSHACTSFFNHMDFFLGSRNNHVFQKAIPLMDLFLRRGGERKTFSQKFLAIIGYDQT